MKGKKQVQHESSRPTDEKKAQDKRFKQLVIDYLQGGTQKRIVALLEEEERLLKSSSKKGYKGIPLEAVDEDPYLLALLTSLNIKKDSNGLWPKAIDNGLKRTTHWYPFLQMLHYDGHAQVGSFLKCVDKARANRVPNRVWAVLAFLSALGVGTALYLRREAFESLFSWLYNAGTTVVEWLGKTFSALQSVSLLGMLYGIVSLLWAWRYAPFRGVAWVAFKARELTFKTLSRGLVLAAYVLAYIAEGIMTPLVGGLLVLSSLTELAESGFEWFSSRKKLDEASEIKKQAKPCWEVEANYLRAENKKNQSTYRLSLDAGLAVGLILTITVTCLLPGGVVASLCCLGLLMVLRLVHQVGVYWMETVHSKRLQEALASQRHLLDLRLDLTPSEMESPSNQKLQKVLGLLKTQEEMIQKKDTVIAELVQKNLDLERRIKTPVSLEDGALPKYPSCQS